MVKKKKTFNITWCAAREIVPGKKKKHSLCVSICTCVLVKASTYIRKKKRHSIQLGAQLALWSTKNRACQMLCSITSTKVQILTQLGESRACQSCSRRREVPAHTARWPKKKKGYWYKSTNILVQAWRGSSPHRGAGKKKKGSAASVFLLLC